MMNVKQGDKFRYNATNGEQLMIEIASTIGNHISYKHIQGKSASGSVHEDYFQQLVESGYFKRMEEDA